MITIKRLRKIFEPRENLFVVLFAAFGLGFIFLTPPIYTYDESAHLYRSYQVSKLNVLPENIVNESGGQIPTSLTKLVSSSILRPNEKYHFKTASSYALKLKLEPWLTTRTVFTNVSIYPFINYLPQALGLGFGRLVSQSVLIHFYLARFFNLIFLAACFYIAIRIVPFGKSAYVVFGLLPMVVFTGASLSADGFTIGSIAVFSALLFKCLTQRTISRRDWIFLGVSTLAVVLAKQTYFLLAPAILALGFKGRRVDWRIMKKALFVLTGVGICLLIYLGLTTGLNNQPIDLGRSVGIMAEPHNQILFMLHNPVAFVAACLRTILSDDTIREFLGAFGTGDILLPLWAGVVSILTLILSLGLREEVNLKVPKNVTVYWMLVCASLNVLLIFVGLYVFWANPGQPHVNSFHSRYLLPIGAFLIPTMLGRFRHSIKKTTLYGAVVLNLMVSLIVISNRFYG